MRKIFTVSALVFFASVLPAAEMWTGQLFDSTCVERHKQLQDLRKYEDCTPRDSTSSFVLQTSGRMLKLDPNGDRKAAEAWRQYMSSADRAVDPDAKTRALTAVIQGTVHGDQIKVDNILLR
jgi:hypothetical protein